jgi:3-hydroxyisobutyrate dehydrogenase-like beta-hydroxyacid dehydrogenase
MSAASPIVVIIAQGEMGAGVGGRLRERGAEVRTSLRGRSAASAERTRRHGLIAVKDDAALVRGADFVLSILPPGEAVALAERLAPALAAATEKPLYVDCNAINPTTMAKVAAIVEGTGAACIDAGIIGGPPRPDAPGPKLYASGPLAARFAILRDWGLDVRVLDDRIGTASALKMAYGSLTKGLTALAVTMALGAARAGVAEALKRELADSQPALDGWLKRQLPKMPPKAYRWVAEMEEIAAHLGTDTPGGEIYEGIARLYEAIARSHAGDKRDIETLGSFVGDR